MTTLFAHLATRLSASPENVAIEALGFLLSRSPAARAAFVRALGGDRSLASDLIFATQASAEDASRPDIEGYAADGSRACVVECKFHAGLTANQPLTYAARLSKDQVGALVFVVPAARLTSLWGELAKRMAAGGFPLASRTEPEPEVWTALFGERHRFVLLSWRAALSAIRHAMEEADEVEHLGDLRQLAGLCERMDTDAFLPLRSEELTGTGVARRYAELGQLAYDVGEALIGEGVCDARRLTPAAGIGYYGRYLRSCDCVFFLGFDSLAWASHGRSPLWLRFDHTALPDVLARLRRLKTIGEDVPIVSDNTRRILIPLRVEPGLERPALIASIASEGAAILEELLDREQAARNAANAGERHAGQAAVSVGQPVMLEALKVVS